MSFEGIDGAGKTTVARALVSRLRRDRADVQLVEVDRPRAGDGYVDAHLDGIKELWRRSRHTEFLRLGELHWILSRASHYALIDHAVLTPALEGGAIAVTDGWYYKFAVRVVENGTRTLPVTLRYFSEIRAPDRVVMLDVPPAVAARRLREFTAGEIGPQNYRTDDRVAAFVGYQTRVRERLLAVAQREGWIVLDHATDGVDVLVERVIAALRHPGWVTAPGQIDDAVWEPAG